MSQRRSPASRELLVDFLKQNVRPNPKGRLVLVDLYVDYCNYCDDHLQKYLSPQEVRQVFHDVFPMTTIQADNSRTKALHQKYMVGVETVN